MAKVKLNLDAVLIRQTTLSPDALNQVSTVFDQPSALLNVHEFHQAFHLSKPDLLQKIDADIKQSKNKRWLSVLQKYFLRAISQTIPRSAWAGYAVVSARLKLTEVKRPHRYLIDIDHKVFVNPLIEFSGNEVYSVYETDDGRRLTKRVSLPNDLAIRLKDFCTSNWNQQVTLSKFRKALRRNEKRVAKKLFDALVADGVFLKSRSIHFEDLEKSKTKSKETNRPTVETELEFTLTPTDRDLTLLMLKRQSIELQTVLDFLAPYLSHSWGSHYMAELAQFFKYRFDEEKLSFNEFSNWFFERQNTFDQPERDRVLNQLSGGATPFFASNSTCATEIQLSSEDLHNLRKELQPEEIKRPKFYRGTALFRILGDQRLQFDYILGGHPIRSISRHTHFSENVKLLAQNWLQLDSANQKAELRQLVYQGTSSREVLTVPLPLDIGRLLLNAPRMKATDITIHDLLIGSDGQRFTLWNRKTGQPIRLIVSTLLNPHQSALLQFRLLSELAHQGDIRDLSFGAKSFGREAPWPRVCYRSIILCPRRWRISREQHKRTSTSVQGLKNSFSDLGIPNKFFLVREIDQKLYFDFTHSKVILAFLEIAPRNDDWIIEEVIDHQSDNSTFKSVLLPFGDADADAQTPLRLKRGLPLDRPKRLPLVDHTQLSVYCHPHVMNRVLLQLIGPALKRWCKTKDKVGFFIRYRDEEGPHIRVRFLGMTITEKKGRVILDQLLRGLTQAQSTGLIRHYKIGRYEPEYHRYENLKLFEQLSCEDSLLVLDHISDKTFDTKQMIFDHWMAYSEVWWPNPVERQELLQAFAYAGEPKTKSAQKQIIEQMTAHNQIELSAYHRKLLSQVSRTENSDSFARDLMHLNANRFDLGANQYEQDLLFELLRANFKGNGKRKSRVRK